MNDFLENPFKYIAMVWALILVARFGPACAVSAKRYIRAWLYVRFFIRYEMAGCALEAKVREGQA